jgi:hypothetical protein
MRHAALATLIAFALAACNKTPEPAGAVTTAPVVTSAVSPPAAPAPPPVAAYQPPVAGSPCLELPKIEQFPDRYGGVMSDPAYLRIKRAGVAALPCLVDEIGNVATMEPADAKRPVFEVAVGDMAFFLLVDLGYVDFLQVLPPDVQAATQTRGVFAYFDWIGGPGHRAQLQQRIRAQLGPAAGPAAATGK